ncbi:SLAP domain-containing protein [Lactobacillus sp.]|uniref:SLAP domain-containing protein n=1 Tax=Lactobacillus sp. TaxID=1591 RepID=UPI0019AA28A8|nr:SLAP domain-containing protein [Lactobacillus sp.]MBD5430727.1 hypothetical protein [Lactobacillus sp.]
MKKFVKIFAAAGLFTGLAATLNTNVVSAAPKRVKVQQSVKTYDTEGNFIKNTKNIKSVKYTGFRLINGQKAYRIGKNAYVLAGDSKAWDKEYLFKVMPKNNSNVVAIKGDKKLTLTNNKIYKVIKVKISQKTGKQLYQLGNHYWVKASQVSVVGDKF